MDPNRWGRGHQDLSQEGLYNWGVVDTRAAGGPLSQVQTYCLPLSPHEGPWRHEFNVLGPARHLDLGVKNQDRGFFRTEPVCETVHFPLKELTWRLTVTSAIKMSFRPLENNLTPDFKGPQIRPRGPFRE